MLCRGAAAPHSSLHRCICNSTHLYRQRASSNGLAMACHQQPKGSCSFGGVGAGVAAVAAWRDRHLAADWPCLQLNLYGQRLQQVSPLAPARMHSECEHLDSHPCKELLLCKGVRASPAALCRAFGFFAMQVSSALLCLWGTYACASLAVRGTWGRGGQGCTQCSSMQACYVHGACQS